MYFNIKLNDKYNPNEELLIYWKALVYYLNPITEYTITNGVLEFDLDMEWREFPTDYPIQISLYQNNELIQNEEYLMP